MIIVQVHIHVKEGSIAAFEEATCENARNSIREPGIARFDVIRQEDDPTRFVLVEAYRSREAQALHKGTPHYEAWRDAVEPMMAEPRYSIRYANVFPDDASW
ncbi:MAG TPA: antibiotic biosynthesis monooxygenase [Deltaproteobacteria bacterium]|nr:antibiotic biosynthesis monooxygenase [Deltaproteobacteria bacterium]HPR55417.1 antibiotic biosynthesis monooxygenase [Deltaproteobacteria bacterium]HXK48143.1 antibiotic biosynthesis monooxygenase [Deltaproteobacteria bacterium]